MVCNCNLVVCDSVNNKKYIHNCYDRKCARGSNPPTTYIAYGTELADNDPYGGKLQQGFQENSVSSNDYYLIVGRFLTENNYETIIQEFSASNTARSLIIITNANTP